MRALFFSEHAVRRFQQRHRPDLSRECALAELHRLAEEASPLKERSLCGDEQWAAGEDGDILFIVRRDGGGRRPTVVTVLPQEGAARDPFAALAKALREESDRDLARAANNQDRQAS